MYFKYYGFDLDNNKDVDGNIEAQDIEEARNILIKKNIVIKKIDNNESSNKNNYFRFFQEDFLDEFTEKLFYFLISDIELQTAFKLMLLDEHNKNLKSFIQFLLEKLNQGDSFYSALKEQTITKIPFYYLESIKIAEENNNIPFVLEKLVEYNEEKNDNKDNIKQALTYPFIILLVASGVLVFMMTSIVPKIVSMFEKRHKELPNVTQYIINISDFLVNNYIHLLYLSVLTGIILFYSYKKITKFKEFIHLFLLKIPVYGELVQNKELGRFLSLLYILLKNNIPANKSLNIASNIIDNIILKKEFKRNISYLSDGLSISDAFKNTKYIKKEFINFLFLSDANNNLMDISKKTSLILKKKNTKTVKKFIAVLEPMSMIIIGAMLGTIIIGILLPIFSLG
jgi:type II secretory pathway component PulF